MRTRFVNSARKSFRPLALLAIFLSLGSLLPTPRAQAGIDLGLNSDVRIGVLGLFHPREFALSATAGHALLLQAGTETAILEKSSGTQSATVQISDGALILTTRFRSTPAPAIIVTGRNGEPVDFNLAIANKISRRYHGTLEIRPSAGILLAILRLDRETAVASVVAAESLPDTPLEALKAQAIAARSYLVAGRGRHQEFDFCDTTHCQFLREPPAAASPVAQAVAATRNLVLVYNSHPFPAMYTRSCSGRTHTPAELKMSSASYPYYAVDCKYCPSHPARWTTRLSLLDSVALRNSDELSRLNTGRRLGWDVVPSNDFVASQAGDHLLLQGTGHGHGIGLCQSGARAMALEGAKYEDILNHYYPNTNVITLPN